MLVPGRDTLRVRRPEGAEKEITAAPLPAPFADPLSYPAAVVRGDRQPEGLSSLSVNLVVTEILDVARESARTGKRVTLPER